MCTRPLGPGLSTRGLVHYDSYYPQTASCVFSSERFPVRSAFSILFLLLSLVSLAAWRSAASSYPAREQASVIGARLSTSSPLAVDSLTDNQPATAQSPQPTMDKLRQLAREILANLRSNVHDYTATLVKRERIGGRLGDEVLMQLKIRNPANQQDAKSGTRTQTGQGLSAYLKFQEPSSMRGREVIWVDGVNDNKLIVHEAGLLNLMRVELVPHGTLAMLGNKYAITEIGLLRLVEKLIEKIDRGVDLSQCSIDTRDGQMVGDRSCRLIQVTQPRSIPGADFYIAQVFIDDQLQIPLRYAAFLWPEHADETPPLEEEYTYLDLQVNVGLTDLDFDPDNPAYNYP